MDSNSLLVFLRNNLEIELKNRMRSLFIFIFRETKSAPNRPPRMPKKMVGMKAKMLKSSKFLTWIEREEKQYILRILPPS